ncbi:MAG: endonuclease, partial [Candidatus Nanoarchaeia archaeon]
MKRKLLEVYDDLLERYGKQDWWPCKKRFEILIGAILTQNTSWKNVEKALDNLRHEGMVDASKILDCDLDDLKEMIKPAGFYNQKAVYLKNIARFYIK